MFLAQDQNAPLTMTKMMVKTVLSGGCQCITKDKNKMKRVIICVLAITLSLALNAQKVTPKAAFDIFTNGYKIILNDQPAKMGDFRTRIGLDFDWRKFTVYADTHVYMNYAGGSSANFRPRLSEYYIGAKFHITKEIKVQYEHLCIHPVKAHGRSGIDKYGGYDMISLSYNY